MIPAARAVIAGISSLTEASGSIPALGLRAAGDSFLISSQAANASGPCPAPFLRLGSQGPTWRGGCHSAPRARSPCASTEDRTSIDGAIFIDFDLRPSRARLAPALVPRRGGP